MKFIIVSLMISIAADVLANNLVIRCTSINGTTEVFNGDSVVVKPEGKVLIQRSIGRGGKLMVANTIDNAECTIAPESTDEGNNS